MGMLSHFYGMVCYGMVLLLYVDCIHTQYSMTRAASMTQSLKYDNCRPIVINPYSLTLSIRIHTPFEIISMQINGKSGLSSGVYYGGMQAIVFSL